MIAVNNGTADKMKDKTRLILIIAAIFISSYTKGQTRNLLGKIIHRSYADSLYMDFSNTLYNAFYNSSYTMTQRPSFTFLKIDIDGKGDVTDVQFSDSADSSLVNAWLKSDKRSGSKATLEKYAKAKSFKNLSLLIPLSFEPNAPNANKQFSYDEMESLLKFNKIDFTDKSVILPPLFIAVLKDHNM